MAMPFPGMDPYLEHPALWTAVHTRLVVWLSHQLGPRLRPRYVTSVEERLVIEGPDEHRIPDIWIQKVRDNGGGGGGAKVGGAPVIVEVEEEQLPRLETREHYIEILDRYQDLRVVTAIEVVSPTNKTTGPGRQAYQLKQQQTLDSECHLVEIDLLRRGRHVLSVPEWRAQLERPCDYLMCVNRWPRRTRFELYPCHLRERLLVIHVPLAEPDPDVPLDLQAALEQAYEDGSYMLRVRYDEPCVPPLEAADQLWANECWAAYRQAHPEWFPQTPNGPSPS